MCQEQILLLEVDTGHPSLQDWCRNSKWRWVSLWQEIIAMGTSMNEVPSSVEFSPAGHCRKSKDQVMVSGEHWRNPLVVGSCPESNGIGPSQPELPNPTTGNRGHRTKKFKVCWNMLAMGPWYFRSLSQHFSSLHRAKKSPVSVQLSNSPVSRPSPNSNWHLICQWDYHPNLQA